MTKIILDLRPTGDIEFMMRAPSGAQMQYLAGAVQSAPVWLRLTVDQLWRVTGSVSPDGQTWTAVGTTFFSPADQRAVSAGLVVTSRRQLGTRRMRLTDDDRRRLAARAYRVGRACLRAIASIATPDTLLRWHRQLIARKWTYARRSGRIFSVGESELVLDRAAKAEECFRVQVADFSPAVALRTLMALGVSVDAVEDGNAISFRDPDGLKVQISR